MIRLLTAFLCIAILQAIFIPIGLNQRRCMSAFTAFEPLKLKSEFPKLDNQTNSGQFRVIIQSTENVSDTEEILVRPGETLRRELRLQTDVIYSICFELLSDRTSLPTGAKEPRICYLISDDLSQLIDTVDVPTELRGEKRLADLYVYAEEISRINAKLAEYQERLHKNLRIVSLTLIECAVVVFAGVYQVFTLRRFLIDKNLY